MYKNRVLPDCPEGTELHPRKNICVEKCKPNRIRDPKTFKCVKDPNAHVVNPLTGRQVQYGYLHKIKTKRSKVLQASMRRQVAQRMHSKSTSSSSHRQVLRPDQPFIPPVLAKKSSSSSSSSSSSHRQVLRPDQPFIPPVLAKKSSSSSSSSSSPKHHMRFLDGKRKGTVVYIRKK
jgi:hypothetical protein